MNKIIKLPILFGLLLALTSLSWGGEGMGGNSVNTDINIVGPSIFDNTLGVSEAVLQNTCSSTESIRDCLNSIVALDIASAQASGNSAGVGMYQAFQNAIDAVAANSELSLAVGTIENSNATGFYFNDMEGVLPASIFSGVNLASSFVTLPTESQTFWVNLRDIDSPKNPYYNAAWEKLGKGKTQANFNANWTYSSLLQQAQQQQAASGFSGQTYDTSGYYDNSSGCQNSKKVIVACDSPDVDAAYAYHTLKDTHGSFTQTVYETSTSVTSTDYTDQNLTANTGQSITSSSSTSGAAYTISGSFVGSGTVNTSESQPILGRLLGGNTLTTTQQPIAVTANYYDSPIILDLKGSGLLEASGGEWMPHPGSLDSFHIALFDFYGNGFPIAMEWPGPDDGILVKPNPDGTIDGRSMFGTADGYDDGFEKLSILDLDHDGVLSGKELDGLYVWVDKNQNAKVDPGELISVKSLGITSISLKHDHFKGSFVMNGKTHVMWDWFPNVSRVEQYAPGAELRSSINER